MILRSTRQTPPGYIAKSTKQIISSSLFRVAADLEHPSRGLGTVTVAEPHIPQHHVWARDLGTPARRGDTVGGGDHGETVGGEVACHRVTPDRVVVDNYHGDRVSHRDHPADGQFPLGAATDTLAGHRDVSLDTACPGANLYAHVSSGDLKRRIDDLLAAGTVDLQCVCGPDAAAIVVAIEAPTDRNGIGDTRPV